ncbi:MAG: hypothetical protein V3V13_06940 [Paracoccaceae bacterium]
MKNILTATLITFGLSVMMPTYASALMTNCEFTVAGCGGIGAGPAGVVEQGQAQADEVWWGEQNDDNSHAADAAAAAGEKAWEEAQEKEKDKPNKSGRPGY